MSGSLCGAALATMGEVEGPERDFAQPDGDADEPPQPGRFDGEDHDYEQHDPHGRDERGRSQFLQGSVGCGALWLFDHAPGLCQLPRLSGGRENHGEAAPTELTTTLQDCAAQFVVHTQVGQSREYRLVTGRSAAIAPFRVVGTVVPFERLTARRCGACGGRWRRWSRTRERSAT